MSLHPIPYVRLIAFVADELDAADAALVTSHLMTCCQCAATVARYSRVREILNYEDDEEPPPATMAKARALFEQHLLGPMQRAPTC